MVFDLGRMQRLMDALGSPQRAYPSIHLTGTNGKTSTARMIDALLRAHGLHTGRYTSPHLETVRERISLDGEPVDEERFVAAYREVAPIAELLDARQDQSLTYFEMTTALALATFADAPVDVAVVEVGLGGAEDATNVLHAPICVVTPIGLDHTEWLGDTLADIALAKSGIIHADATVVCAAQEEPAAEPLLRRCAEVGATIAREGAEFGVLRRALAVGGQLLTLQGLGGVYDDVLLPLHGAHQAQNAAVALAAVEAFLGAGAHKQLDPEVVREGFAAASSPGRLERVRSAPTILLDGAHNPHGMAATVAALAEEFAFRRLVAVVAVFADKDVAGVLELLEPVVDEVVVT
ncbi:MAG TPA: folylpolyglutamate synthase/dihydrofolate synthase family protein, partial [Pilimelia sp.]|nr:folylpolyglutamate synthase/dihydrofolate synthase family protein [Pilimelia sp.]